MTCTPLALTQALFLVFLFSIAAEKANCAGQEPIPDLAEATLEQLGSVKVYSASRHLQAAGDAPSSVTVVTADEIQKYGYRTLADILKTVPGFFVTNDRDYSSVGVRGLARPGDYNTRILLLVDGHRLNDNVYDEAMVGTEFPINIDLIQRVEVIRGPVSSLYGSNALFGVINIITKRGRDIDGLELSAEAASFNTYSGTVTYGRKLRQLEFLISSTFYGSQGHNSLFFPEFNTPETNYGIARHADDDQVGSALATISFRDFTLQAVYGTREKGIPTAPYGTVFNNSGTRTTDSNSYIDLRYQHRFGNSWDVLARTFYDRYTYRGTYIYASPLDPSQTSPNLDFADGKWWGAEQQVSKTVLRRNRITAGGEYRDNLRQDQTNYDPNPYVLYLADKRQSFVGALYVQDELTLSKSLALNVGFRYDYYSTRNASGDPRFALIYRPWRRTGFKFIYGEAFRVPNVYELCYAASPYLSNPALNSEKIRNAEFIWEQGLGTHLWFSTSAFYSSIQDLITQESVGDNFIFRNLKNVRSSGLEVEVKGQLSPGLEGRASYSFQQTKDTSSGQFLSNSPRNLVTLNLSQPLWGKRMFVSLDAQYRSRIQNLAGGSISPFAVVNATLLARNLGKRVDLSASIYNLLDKQYFDPPSTENLQQAIQQDGRSFRVKMTWRWGGR